MQSAQKVHWKDRAIQGSGVINDLWDIFISYMSRLSVWILFSCMVLTIVSMLVNLPLVAQNAALIVEIVTLDIAGFGLSTISDLILKKSHDDHEIKIADNGKKLATTLITISITTLVLAGVKTFYPQIASYVEYADETLVLTRLVLIVLYMHAMHSLREVEKEMVHTEQQTQVYENRQLASVQTEIDNLKKMYTDAVSNVQSQFENIQKVYIDQISDVQEQVKNIHTLYIEQTSNIQTTDSKLATLATKIDNFTVNITENIQHIQQTYINNPAVSTPIYTITEEPLSEQPAQIPATTQSTPENVVQALIERTGKDREMIISLYDLVQRGENWTTAAKALNLNYSRIVKPIRDVYVTLIAEQ